MLLAVAAHASSLFCHKSVLVTLHLYGGTKVEVSSFCSPDTKVSFVPIALPWFNLAVAKVKTSPVSLLDLHSVSLLNIKKKISWRESY